MIALRNFDRPGEVFFFSSVASQKFSFQTSSIMSPLVLLFFTALVASALGEEGQARILISKQVNFALCIAYKGGVRKIKMEI